MATRYPFMNVPGFYFSKLYQATSYIVAINTKNNPLKDMYINVSSLSILLGLQNLMEKIFYL